MIERRAQKRPLGLLDGVAGFAASFAIIVYLGAASTCAAQSLNLAPPSSISLAGGGLDAPSRFLLLRDHSTTLPDTSHRLDAPSWFLLLREDTTSVLTAPMRWEPRVWRKVALGVGAVGVLLLADGKIRDEMQRSSGDTTHRVATAVEPFGNKYSFGALAAFYGAGKLFENPKAAAVAEDGLASSLIAAGLITPLIKSIAGRSRPSQSSRNYDFLRGNASFPSGHATQAFAVASVVAGHYDSRWVDTLAYGLAGLVAWSRVESQAHFVSDVVAGALIGIGVGRSVVRLNSERRIQFEPIVTRQGAGLAVRFDPSNLRRRRQ